MIIQNYERLAVTPQRKVVLDLIEHGLTEIQPDEVIAKNIRLNENTLEIENKTFDLSFFERIFIIGFGKGSARNSQIIANTIGDRLTQGYVIDTVPDQFQDNSKVYYVQGTHPLPSQANIDFTKRVIEDFSGKESEKDLILVVVCGGGSALFEFPFKHSLEEQTAIFKAMLEAGTTIRDMNIVRKHLSQVKGGGLAKILYPGTVASLIFSDVPGNDLATIASGPTEKDPSTIEDVFGILKKYNLDEKLNLTQDDFIETPTDDKYFENAHNIFILSNLTILHAIEQKARSQGIQVTIFSDKFQGEARDSGISLIHATPPQHLLLAGGETTVTVRGEGKGGRNQEVVLGALEVLDEKTIIASFGTDGQDNSEHAGAIGDIVTVQKAEAKFLEPREYLDNSNSFAFFEKTEDALITGKLPSNVADIIMVYKYD